MTITEKREKEVSARKKKLDDEISKVCQLVDNKIESIPEDWFNLEGNDYLYFTVTYEMLIIRLNSELLIKQKLKFDENFNDFYPALCKQLDQIFEDCKSESVEWKEAENKVYKSLVF